MREQVKQVLTLVWRKHECCEDSERDGEQVGGSCIKEHIEVGFTAFFYLLLRLEILIGKIGPQRNFGGKENPALHPWEVVVLMRSINVDECQRRHDHMDHHNYGHSRYENLQVAVNFQVLVQDGPPLRHPNQEHRHSYFAKCLRYFWQNI